MKSFLFSLILSLSALSQMAFAQAYLPFPNNLSNYYFISNDSIFSMTVGSYPPSGSTKIYAANPAVKKGKIRSGNSTCIGMNTTYHEQANNQFGDLIYEDPNGDFRFRVKHGTFGQEEFFLLKTKVAAGQGWGMNANAGLWVTYTGKSLYNFKGVSDSVMFFSLSDGKRILLSKNYGLIECPNFPGYVTGSDFPRRQLVLYKLPDANFAQNSISSPFIVFDFQPNDRFSYYKTASILGLGSCEVWEQIKILTRRISQTNDTIYYTLERQRYVKGNTQIINTSNILTPVVEQLIIHRSYYPETNCRTNAFSYGSPYFVNSNRSMVSTAITRSAQFNQRELMLFRDLYGNSGFAQPNPACGNMFIHYFDSERKINFGTGIGKTYESILDLSFFSTETLQAYVKGTETYGTWRPISQIMAAEKELENATLKAYPNPFTSEVALQFSSSFSAGKATVLVSNVLGQEVFKQEITVTPGQENRLEMSHLPKGMYVLKAEQNGKVFTTRLVKE